MFNNKIEGRSPKWKTKKQKQKSITKPIKKNCKKDHENIIEIFLKMRKLEKNYANNRNENISDKNRETENEYMRNYYYKSKNLLNHLINCVEKLENVSLD